MWWAVYIYETQLDQGNSLGRKKMLDFWCLEILSLSLFILPRVYALFLGMACAVQCRNRYRKGGARAGISAADMCRLSVVACHFPSVCFPLEARCCARTGVLIT